MDFPKTRYYGSKRRVVERIWAALCEEGIEFDSMLDLFGGTGIVSYMMLRKGKEVTFNDVFKFNCLNAQALLATPKHTFTIEDAYWLLQQHDDVKYRHLIEDNFEGVYFTNSENQQIDIIAQNIPLLDVTKQACGSYLLNQACMIKRPFNIFHRNNLHLRLNHVISRFGNYVTWEKTFDSLFNQFVKELNDFQFEITPNVHILNQPALSCVGKADLVYIDTPYFSNGSNLSYHARYHFLEGLTHYQEIPQFINYQKKNKEIEINKNEEFEQKSVYLSQLQELFDHYRDSILVMSYTTNGYPTVDELVSVMKQFKNSVTVRNLGRLSFALNRDNYNREEILIIGKN